MDSPKLAYPEEQGGFDFLVLSTSSELSDIDNWRTCCSDDSRGLPSSVENCSSSTVVSDDADTTAYMRLASAPVLSNKGSISCPSSPREYNFPESCSYSPTLLSCPPSWLELRPQLEDEVGENRQVPLSSSPPEFTSSSLTSDISSELEKKGSSSPTSASAGSRSDTASISVPHDQHSDCGGSDQFSQRLHELLLLVLRGRELLRSRTEETDCTTCTSRSDDPCQSFENQASRQIRYPYLCAYMH